MNRENDPRKIAKESQRIDAETMIIGLVSFVLIVVAAMVM